MHQANEARIIMFSRIKNATTMEELQQIALRLWHDVNATQEGFICPGCANCAIVEFVGEPPQTQL